MRHGGSAELAPPAAKGIRLVREEKRKAKDPPMFTVASLPRGVGAARYDLHAYNWSKSRLRRVKDQAEDCGHTQDGSQSTNKFSEKYILTYRCGS